MPGHRERVRGNVRRAAVPYGYTVVTWTCGSVLIGTHGPPDMWDAYLFLAGACLAYGVLWLLAGAGDSPEDGTRAHGSVVAAAVALGCGGGTAHVLDGRIAFAAVSFVATLVYLTVRH